MQGQELFAILKGIKGDYKHQKEGGEVCKKQKPKKKKRFSEKKQEMLCKSHSQWEIDECLNKVSIYYTILKDGDLHNLSRLGLHMCFIADIYQMKLNFLNIYHQKLLAWQKNINKQTNKQTNKNKKRDFKAKVICSVKYAIA